MKKSLGLLMCLIAIPALLGCSRKNSSESKQSEQPASSEPAPAPSSSEKEQDPEEVLPDFKDATEVTVNNDLSGNFPIVAGTPLRFKFHFGQGFGKDRFLGLTFYGSNISKANKVESQWLDYKGQPVAKNDYGYAWGQYDGWMYLEINKTESTEQESKVTIVSVKSLDTRLPVIADGGQEADLHDKVVQKNKEIFFSFVAEKGKNYAISFHTTGTGKKAYSGYDPDGEKFNFDDAYLTKYQYNYIATKSGIHAVRLYVTDADVTLSTGAIVQIDIPE